MAKEKAPLFEKMVFNNVQYAKDIMSDCEAKLAKCKRGMVVATVGTLCGVPGLLFNGAAPSISSLLVFTAIILAIIAYSIGGGVKIAFSWAWKLCKFGWFIIPVFPFDLVVGVFAFVIAILAFFCVPILFVWLNKRQLTQNYEAAKQYLSYCQTVIN